MEEQVFDIEKFFYIKKLYEQKLKALIGKDSNLGWAVFAEVLYDKVVHSQQELSDMVACNKAHTSRTLLKMQQKGLVKVNLSNSSFSLTAKGKQFAEKVIEIRNEVNKKLVEDINQKDLQTFTKVFLQILANGQTISRKEE